MQKNTNEMYNDSVNRGYFIEEECHCELTRNPILVSISLVRKLCGIAGSSLRLPPYHLVHDAGVGLDEFDYFG